MEGIEERDDEDEENDSPSELKEKLQEERDKVEQLEEKVEYVLWFKTLLAIIAKYGRPVGQWPLMYQELFRC